MFFGQNSKTIKHLDGTHLSLQPGELEGQDMAAIDGNHRV